MRLRLPWLTATVICVTFVTFLGWNRLGRSDSPEEAWRRAQRAWLANDHGAVYDCLSVAARVEADALFGAERAKDADRYTDPEAVCAYSRAVRGAVEKPVFCGHLPQSVSTRPRTSAVPSQTTIGSSAISHQASAG